MNAKETWIVQQTMIDVEEVDRLVTAFLSRFGGIGGDHLRRDPSFLRFVLYRNLRAWRAENGEPSGDKST